MRRAILGVKLVLLLVWTALAFGLYGALNLLGGLIEQSAGMVPLPAEGLDVFSWLLQAAQAVGFGVVVIVWLVGAVVIVVLGLLARRLAAERWRESLGRARY